MSLSIVPLVQSLYNVHKAYKDVVDRYGEEVYIHALFEDVPTGQTKAPSRIVRELAETYVSQMMSMYNLRVAILMRKESEINLARYYLGIAIVILLVLGGSLTYAFVHSYIKCKKNENCKPTPAIYLAKFIIYVFAVWIAVIFLMVLAILMYARKVASVESINNIQFDPSVFRSIAEIAPYLFININDPVYLKHVASKETNEYFLYLDTLPIGSTGKFGISLSLYNKLNGNEKLNSTDKRVRNSLQRSPLTQSMRVHMLIIAYVLSRRNININIDNIRGDDFDTLKFPGFPSESTSEGAFLKRFYRDIQAVDIVGQVTRLKDSVDYFKTLLQRDTNAGANNPQKRIIDAITRIFSARGIFIKSMIPARDAPEMTMLDEATDAAKAAADCLQKKTCSYSFYDLDTNIGASVDPVNGRIFPLYYTADGSDYNKRFDVFIKSGQEVYIANPHKFESMPLLSRAMYKLDGPVIEDLPNESGCMLSMTNGKCVSENYSTSQSVADYQNAFAEMTTSEAMKNRNMNNTMFTIKTTTDNIIANEIAKHPDIIEKSREHYITMVIDIIKREDPSLKFTFDASTTQVIGDAVASAFPEIANQARMAFTDILNEIPIRLAKESQRMTSSGEVDPRDLQYVNGQELLAKIASMNGQEFVGNFVSRLYDAYSTTDGLKEMHAIYDRTVDDINRATVTLRLFGSLVMLEGLAYCAYFGVTKYPEFKGAKKTLEDAITSATDESKKKIKQTERRELITDYALKWLLILSIIFILVVVIFISATRRESIGFYNYNVMNRNADILRDESKSAFFSVLEDMQSQAYSVASTDLAFVNTLEPNRYVIDDFKDNISGFSSDVLVVTNNVDGTGLRNKLVEIITSYEKCNALLFGSNIEMPFPLYEMSIYLFIIFMVILCAMILTFKMEPFDKLKRLQQYNRIRENHKKNKHIKQVEIPGICNDVDDLDADTDLIIKILTVVLIPVSALLFATQLIQSTDSLNTALYGSNLYRSNTCYTI